MTGDTSSSAATSPIAVDAHGRLTRDAPCIKCNYNLRGALAEGRCPECGLAVGRSTTGHWLRYCDPNWLATVWGGLNRLAILIGCAAALAILTIGGIGALAWVAATGTGSKPASDAAMLTVAIVGVALIATGVVFGVHGVWRATTPDPAKLPEPTLTRIAARVLTAAGVLLLLVAFVIAPFVVWSDLSELPWLLANAGWLLCVLGVFNLLLYGRHLARRIPRPWLARASLALGVVLLLTNGLAAFVYGNWFGWRYGIEIVFDSFGGGITYYHYGGGYYWWLISLIDLTVTLLLVGTVLLLPPLFIWFWVALTREARLARETWAR